MSPPRDDYLRILVYLVIYDSSQVSREHLLLSMVSLPEIQEILTENLVDQVPLYHAILARVPRL